MNSSGWMKYSLGEICSFIGGSVFPRESQNSSYGTIPFIKVSDLNTIGNERWIDYANNYVSESEAKRLKTKIHPPLATTFAKIGIALTFNRRRLLRKATIVDNNMASAVSKKSIIDPIFLYYLLLTIDFNKISSGTALPYLNFSDLEQIPVEIPPLSTQHRITKILCSLDDKIELNRQTNATLEAIAQAIFKEWFVDFNYPGATGEMVDSELGPIPKGWNMDNLGGFTTVSSGKGLKRTEFTDEGYPVLGANGQIGSTNNYLLDGEVILTGRVGTLGTLQLINKKVWISDNVLIITPKEHFYYHYMYFWLKTIDFQNLNRGSTQPLITKTDLLNLLILRPKLSVLIDYDRICRGLFTLLENNNNEAGILSNIRDHLLPKLMSTKVDLCC